MRRSNIGTAIRSGQRLALAERVYVSSPLHLYGTPRLEAAVQFLRDRYPEAVLLLPAQLFRDRRDWLTRGESVLDQCTQLVVVTDDDGWIGRGVWHEVTVVRHAGRPVAWCQRPGVLIPWEEVTWSPPDETNWTRYTHLTQRQGP